MAVPLMLSPSLAVEFVDKRRSGRAGITDATSLVDYSDFASPATLDAALTAFDAVAYPAAILQKMTINDKMYALRVAQESASI